jgi:hypothetical protein
MKYNVGAQISVREKLDFAAPSSNLSKVVQIFIMTFVQVDGTFDIVTSQLVKRSSSLFYINQQMLQYKLAL